MDEAPAQTDRRLVAVRPASFKKIWDDRKTGSKPHNVSFWRPVPPPGFHRVADLAQRTHEKEPLKTRSLNCLVVAVNVPAETSPVELLRPPIDYTCIWTDKRSGGRYGDCSLWVPVAPEGYCALGCVAAVGYEKPGLGEFMCVHRSLCLEAGVVAEDQTGPLWKDAHSGAVNDVSIWVVAPLRIGEGLSIDAFLAVPHHGDKVNPSRPFDFCGLYALATTAVDIHHHPAPAPVGSSVSQGALSSSSSSPSPLLPYGVDPSSVALERDDTTGLTVPKGLLALKRLFYAMGGPAEEGIFRIAGSEQDLKKMQVSLNNPKNIDKQGNFGFDVFPNDVHTVSSLIKRWYRELPTRLLANSGPSIRALSSRLLASPDDPTTVEAVKQFPNTLQPLFRDLFLVLMDLGRIVARNSGVNKMVPRNIAVVFAPILIARTAPLEEMMLASEAMPFLVAYLECD